MSKIAKGSWVEIEKQLLEPSQRAHNLPEETRSKPYMMRVSGFLQAEAEVGEEVTIRTMIGREHTGTLRVDNPSYMHTFGTTVPELLGIGMEERQ